MDRIFTVCEQHHCFGHRIGMPHENDERRAAGPIASQQPVVDRPLIGSRQTRQMLHVGRYGTEVSLQRLCHHLRQQSSRFRSGIERKPISVSTAKFSVIRRKRHSTILPLC